MRWLSRLLRPITHPVITDDHALRRYVGRVTATAVLLALILDIEGQLLFFTGWQTALRSWALTIVDAGVIALPIALLIGRAQRDLHLAKREVELLSRTDVLTGLPNRRAIMDQVSRPGPAIMILAIADIDRFKSINDRHGHRSGDAVIRAVGQALAAELAGLALVGRLGGEEYAVLASAEAAGPVLRALATFRERLARSPFEIEGVTIPVTISAGAAVRDMGDPFDRLYAEADAALYVAKNGGRNRIALSPRLDDLYGDQAGGLRAA